MVKALIVALMLTTSCHAPGLKKTTGEPYYTAELSTIDDVRQHDGQFVKVTGIFDHVKWIHASIVTTNNLKVFIPHFDEFKKGEDWLKYVGKNVVVIGRIRMHVSDAEGYNQPSMIIHYFAPVE